jgi:hypothetical protein
MIEAGLLTTEMYKNNAVVNSTILWISCGVPCVMLFVTGCSRADILRSISVIRHVLKFIRNLTTALLDVCTFPHRLLFGTK